MTAALTIDNWELEVAAEEARLDIEDGPREWVLVTKIVRRESTFTDSYATTGFAVHHRTCGYLRNVCEPSTMSDPMRLPHAIEVAATPGKVYDRKNDCLRFGVPVTVCRRCAGRVREQVDFFRAMNISPIA